jgi:putative flippase GtrA
MKKDLRGVRRFIKYSGIGAGTFLLDLTILFLASSYLGVSYFIATPCAFFVGISFNYFISRRLVFKGTTRAVYHGYINFAVVGILGAVITTGLVFMFVHFLALYYLIARILVAGIVGVGNYFINLYLNFKVNGNHY